MRIPMDPMCAEARSAVPALDVPARDVGLLPLLLRREAPPDVPAAHAHAQRKDEGKHPGPGVELDAGEGIHGQERRHDREAEERGSDLVVARDGSWALDGDGAFGCFHVSDLPWCW